MCHGALHRAYVWVYKILPDLHDLQGLQTFLQDFINNYAYSGRLLKGLLNISLILVPFCHSTTLHEYTKITFMNPVIDAHAMIGQSGITF